MKEKKQKCGRFRNYEGNKIFHKKKKENLFGKREK